MHHLVLTDDECDRFLKRQVEQLKAGQRPQLLSSMLAEWLPQHRPEIVLVPGACERMLILGTGGINDPRPRQEWVRHHLIALAPGVVVFELHRPDFLDSLNPCELFEEQGLLRVKDNARLPFFPYDVEVISRQTFRWAFNFLRPNPDNEAEKVFGAIHHGAKDRETYFYHGIERDRWQLMVEWLAKWGLTLNAPLEQ